VYGTVVCTVRLYLLVRYQEIGIDELRVEARSNQFVIVLFIAFVNLAIHGPILEKNKAAWIPK
jgi:hypothetical protein